MGNQRFSITSSRAVEDNRITDGQFRTLAALGVFGDKDGWCFPSLKLLSIMLNKSRQMVSRDIAALEELGYLQKFHQFDDDGSRKPSRIRLAFDTPPVNSGGLQVSTPEVDRVSTLGVDRVATPEVDTLSTPEVYINDPFNAPLNAPITDNTKSVLFLADTPSEKNYFATFNRKRWANEAQRVAFKEAESKHGESAMLEAIKWAALNNIPRLPAIFKCAAKIAKQNKKPAPTPTTPAPNGTRRAKWQ